MHFALLLLLLNGYPAGSVRPAIERAVNATTQDEQQAAFDDIVKLGCRAVPEIVSVMDDDRPLPLAYIRLSNDDDPHAFEAFSQYAPRVVTDALAAILNQLTWRDFGFIYNGGTTEERRKVVKAWRNYVRDTPKAKLCAAKR